MLPNLIGRRILNKQSGQSGTVLKVEKKAYDDLLKRIPENERAVTCLIEYDDGSRENVLINLISFNNRKDLK